jgi:2-desacetyl-2-hydroxyethyl bacteriochlorophyllide A dehydrogenase
MRTDALVFSAPGTCEIASYDLPEELGRGEVLLRNRLGLISPGTELAIFCRTHRGFEVEGHWARYPYYPGYCSVADVVAVGDKVTTLSPGDRVVHQGNHATHARQPATAVVKIGRGLADERAVFLKMLGIALTPHLLAPVRFGESGLVFGLGMVGNLASQLCREAGAYPLTAVDLLPARVEIGRACGLDGATTERGDATAAYVIEAVGLAVAFRDALAAVEPDGRVIVLSSPRERVEIDPYFDIHHRGVQVIGAHEWRRSREQRAPYDPFLEHLLTTGRVQVDPLVTHRVAFADAQRAYEGLRDEPQSWLGVLLEYS